jgi:hypothetical protein
MAGFYAQFHSTTTGTSVMTIECKVGGDGIITDNMGGTFSVIGDKHRAALAMLESAMKPIEVEAKVEQIGPVEFLLKEKKVIDIRSKYFGEERPEVIETIEIMKSALKLKAFM